MKMVETNYKKIAEIIKEEIRPLNIHHAGNIVTKNIIFRLADYLCKTKEEKKQFLKDAGVEE